MPDGALPDRPVDEDSRVLCAAVWTNPSVAVILLNELGGERGLRWRPAPTLDEKRLLEQATAADAVWARRRRVTTLVWVAVMFLIAVGVFYAFLVPLVSGGATVLVMTGLLWQWNRNYIAVDDARILARTFLVPESDGPAGVLDPDPGNVVVYSPEAPHPFVGSGRKVGEWLMSPVDVSLGRDLGDGRRSEPLRFEVPDLHTFLDPEGGTTPLRLDGVRVDTVLCVRGDVATEIEGLVPDPDRPPERHVPTERLRQGAVAPTSVARTYTRISRYRGCGRSEVTVFVRFTLERSMLAMEMVSLVLPGIDPDCPLVPGYTAGRFTRDLLPTGDLSVSQVVNDVAVLLLVPFWRLWRDTKISERVGASPARDARARREGGPVDRGGWWTLRERLAERRVRDHFDAAEATEALHRIEHAVLRALKSFLEDHDVDTSQLDEREKHIVNTHTYHIGQVDGVGHHIGSGGSTFNGQRAGQE
ncbi:hypothetical protein [Actinoplanes sp. HUAS TT8]|uniref:hypothetical protein n=1 Tax=Actinoplanes sp. HUAS TT8 TaxID=3447453 RepID=UPI003F51BB27